MRNSLAKIRMRHLQLLNLLVELGSLRQAAAQLHITQPAASRMLRDLECGFGGTLFERSALGVFPSSRALTLVQRGQVLLKELEFADKEINALQPKSCIRIGAVSHIAMSLMPKAVALLESRAADLRLEIKCLTMRPLVEALTNGSVDCIVGRLSPWLFSSGMPVSGPEERSLHPNRTAKSDKAIDYWVLYEEPLCVVANIKHAIAKQAITKWSDLATLRWLLPSDGGLVYGLIEKAFLAAGYPMAEATIVCDQYVCALPIIAEADLITVVPRKVAEQYKSRVKILKMDSNIASPPIIFAQRSSRSDMAPLLEVRTAILDAAKAAG